MSTKATRLLKLPVILLLPMLLGLFVVSVLAMAWQADTRPTLAAALHWGGLLTAVANPQLSASNTLSAIGQRENDL